MKLGLLFLSAAVTVSSAAGNIKGYEKLQVKDFKADTSAAKKLLDVSTGDRKMEDYNFDEAFVAGHSIVYQECYNQTGWTQEGFMKQVLVRYTLCPTGSCYSSGCTSSHYGEYLVDLQTFLDAYLESKLEAIRYKCEMMREVCGCNDENSACLYYCQKSYDDDTFTWQYCANEQGEEERYAECQRLEINNGNDRALENNPERRADWNIYVGPVCSEGGFDINLAIFSDEDCQYEHSWGNKVYEMLSGGDSLPYSTTSLITNECVSCLEPKEEDDQNDDDYEDEDQVSRFCEETYNMAARCEQNMYQSYYYYQDNSGCNYIEALKNGKYGGWYNYQLSFNDDSSFAATILGAFLAIFAVGAAYIYKKKRDNDGEEVEGEADFDLGHVNMDS